MMGNGTEAAVSEAKQQKHYTIIYPVDVLLGGTPKADSHLSYFLQSSCSVHDFTSGLATVCAYRPLPVSSFRRGHIPGCLLAEFTQGE
jgi:hypothetical protein